MLWQAIEGRERFLMMLIMNLPLDCTFDISVNIVWSLTTYRFFMRPKQNRLTNCHILCVLMAPIMITLEILHDNRSIEQVSDRSIDPFLSIELKTGWQALVSVLFNLLLALLFVHSVTRAWINKQTYGLSWHTKLAYSGFDMVLMTMCTTVFAK